MVTIFQIDIKPQPKINLNAYSYDKDKTEIKRFYYFP